MNDEPRCPTCRETRRIEKVCKPIWASVGATLYWCEPCQKTFLFWLKEPSPSI